MWTHTSLTQLLGIDYPIIQGAFGGGLSSAELVAAVSNSGGLGSFGAYTNTPQEIRKIIGDIKKLTTRPYAINLWVNDVDVRSATISEDEYRSACEIFRPYFNELSIPLPLFPGNITSKFDEQVEALLNEAPPVFSFVFGVPPAVVIREAKRRNIKTVGAATTVDEAVMLDENGVDVIVATGFEAGGHRPSFLRKAEDSLFGVMSLVPQVVDNVKAPVVAAGGIADGRGVAAALMLGASGAQIGTAFLACDESNATVLHREMILSKEKKSTGLTKTFTGRLARGSESRIGMELQDHVRAILPLPIQSMFLSPLRAEAIKQGKSDMITFWMGQSASLVSKRKAGLLMESLVQETSQILNQER